MSCNADQHIFSGFTGEIPEGQRCLCGATKWETPSIRQDLIKEILEKLPELLEPIEGKDSFQRGWEAGANHKLVEVKKLLEDM